MWQYRMLSKAFFQFGDLVHNQTCELSCSMQAMCTSMYIDKNINWHIYKNILCKHCWVRIIYIYIYTLSVLLLFRSYIILHLSINMQQIFKTCIKFDGGGEGAVVALLSVSNNSEK